jgi:hypothetical protein
MTANPPGALRQWRVVVGMSLKATVHVDFDRTDHQCRCDEFGIRAIAHRVELDQHGGMTTKTDNQVKRRWPPVPVADRASTLLPKLAKALAKPGIKRLSVFSGPFTEKTFAFSVYPADMSMLIRESFDGKKQVVRMTPTGRFVVVKDIP